MTPVLQGVLSVLGRLALSTIFVLSTVGNKIPNFSKVADFMGTKGMPAPRLLLVGAIVFLIAGSLSVILGFRARIGAFLLLVFLIMASYYFHDFWHLTGHEAEEQTIQFMKNLSMMGAMLFIIANGSGAWSLDSRIASPIVHRAAPAE